MGNRFDYSINRYFSNILQPWKLFSLLIGLGLLIYGAEEYKLPDWDIPISLIMGILTYLTAGWSVRALIKLRGYWMLLALFWVMFTVDNSYFFYWSIKNAAALDLRWWNFRVSLLLYFIYGLILYPEGSLKDLFKQLIYAIRNPRKSLS